MSALNKPGVFTVVKVVKALCRFEHKHSGTFLPAFQAALATDDYAKVVALFAAIDLVCTIFNIAYPDIKP